MKKLILSVLLFICFSSYGQHFSLRKTSQSNSVMLSVPVNTVTHGNVSLILSKEKDRKIAYIHYTEYLKVFKNFNLYGGAGIHMGSRTIMNFKRDANSIFLMGGTLILGMKYDIGKTFFVATDLTPRVDLPLFGGCEMHEKCGEGTFGNFNFSVGLNLN